MTCLGERITTLTDGELGHDARDRALSHVASCPRCRAALDTERSLKARLAHAPTPEPSDALTSRLLRLAEPGDPLPPPSPRMPGTQRPAPLPAPGRPRSGHRVFAAGPAMQRSSGGTDAMHPGVARSAPVTHVLGSPPRRTRRRMLAGVGALSMLGVAVGGALVLGSPTQPPAVRPSVARFSLEHAATAQLPLRDPAVNAVTASLGQRSVLPEERSR